LPSGAREWSGDVILRFQIPVSLDYNLAALSHRRWRSAAGANMNSGKLAAIVLIIAGVLGLAYGSFSYTKQTHDIKMGPIEMSVQEKKTVNVPVWAGIGAIALGAALLLLGGRKL
jgi:hypothetical protein